MLSIIFKLVIQIGNSNYNSNYFWRGELDDIRVYSKALNQQEIETVMSRGTLAVNENILSPFIFYPNPVKDKLSIKAKEVISTEYKASVYDIQGRKIKNLSTKKNSSEILEINTRNLSAGVYVVLIESNNIKHSQRFIKQ